METPDGTTDGTTETPKRTLGFIKLSREYFSDKKLFRLPNDEFKVLMYLYATANFKENVYGELHIRPGQTLKGLNVICTDTELDGTTAFRCLRKLKAREYIEFLDVGGLLFITLNDYELMQH